MAENVQLDENLDLNFAESTASSNKLPDRGSRKRKNRHPFYLHDGIESKRSELFYLLDKTWPTIGWILVGISDKKITINSVQESLGILRDTPGWDLDPIQSLLRPVDAASLLETRAWLASAGRQSVTDRLHLMAKRRERLWREQEQYAAELRNDCALLKRLEGKIKELMGLSKREKKRIDARRDLLKTKIRKSKIRLFRVKQEVKNLDQLKANCRSEFARSQLVDFCTSRRYRLTPWAVASALAGLPSIGWRRSIARCSVYGAPRCAKCAGRRCRRCLFGQCEACQIRRCAVCKSVEGDCKYAVVKTLTKLLDRWDEKTGLLQFIKRRILKSPPSRLSGVPELKKNVQLLLVAAKAAQQCQVSIRELPYAICREYFLLIENSSADLSGLGQLIKEVDATLQNN